MPWKPAPVVAPPAPPVEAAATGAVVAPPSEAMRALAVVAEGTAAVSADVAGNVRLWPSLDGTREPVVIAMRRPVALAIMRAGQDLVIAGVDGAGQLELAEVGPSGEPRWRKPVELRRPVVDMRATETGFLVETDDQHLGFVDLAARLQGEVEPPPGMDIAAIAVSSDRMLALLAGDGAVHGQWLVVGSFLHWGEETGALPIAPRAVALSPDSKMLAGIVEDSTSTRLAVIGIEHADRRAIGPDNQFLDPSLRPVRWLDDATVLAESSQQPTLWTIDGDALNAVSSLPQGPTATDGGATAVFGIGAELMLADPTGTTRFLGFRMPSLTALAPSGHSLLASDGQRVIRLGEDLHEYASYDVAALYAPESPNVLALLDAGHVLVQFYGTVSRIDVVALDTLEMNPVDESAWLAYDPATRLAAFRQGDSVQFRRFDAKTGAFGSAAELATGPSTPNVELTDGGAFVTTFTGSGSVTRTVTKIRPERGTLEVTRSRKQKVTDVTPPVFGPAPPPFWRSVKSPDGTLTARLGNGRLSLADAEGKVRWTVPAIGASWLYWLPSGELLATGAGIARVDVDTGAFTERRCGWEFGLWPQNSQAFASATICDAE